MSNSFIVLTFVYTPILFLTRSNQLRGFGVTNLLCPITESRINIDRNVPQYICNMKI